MVAIAVKHDNLPAFPSTQASDKQSYETRQGIRQTLRQAVELQKLSYDVAMQVKNASSPEELEFAQARAKAAYDATKAWEISVDRVRIVRGKPMPGSLRPESKPKKSKSKLPTFSESKPD